MVQAVKVTATDFARGFSKYREEAFGTDVIEVTSHGRVIGGYLSAKELEHYRALKQRERDVILVSEMDDDLAAAIMKAEYGKASE
ncbi:hypothetical protein [Rhizobium oryzicola]|uniref:Antitoxin n=1 Tax=Rhizobium oryzicola TaxID=1232668 RepID=A0ABT8SV00_9HYPH|nr:hypothetical protein [Rhizobium oryzicola]MDO1582253.1 hypothetical protein [Rhizobium oryzicola]